jgi:hypothetical protein
MQECRLFQRMFYAHTGPNGPGFLDHYNLIALQSVTASDLQLLIDREQDRKLDIRLCNKIDSMLNPQIYK